MFYNAKKKYPMFLSCVVLWIGITSSYLNAIMLKPAILDGKLNEYLVWVFV